LPKSEEDKDREKAMALVRAGDEYRDFDQHFMDELRAEQAKNPDRFVVKLGELRSGGSKKRSGRTK
jgi:hypothetical protein